MRRCKKCILLWHTKELWTYKTHNQTQLQSQLDQLTTEMPLGPDTPFSDSVGTVLAEMAQIVLKAQKARHMKHTRAEASNKSDTTSQQQCVISCSTALNSSARAANLQVLICIQPHSTIQRTQVATPTIEFKRRV